MRARSGWFLLSTVLIRLIPSKAQADQREIDCFMAMINSDKDENMFLNYSEFLHWMVEASDGCLTITDLLNFDEFSNFQEIACTCNDYPQINNTDLPCVSCGSGSNTPAGAAVIALPGVYPYSYNSKACSSMLAIIDHLCHNESIWLELTASPITRAPATNAPVATMPTTSAPVAAPASSIEPVAPFFESDTTVPPVVVNSPSPVAAMPTNVPSTTIPSITTTKTPTVTDLSTVVTAPTTDATNGDDTSHVAFPPSDDDDDGLSGGAIGGIVVAVLLAVVCVVGCGYRSLFAKASKLESSAETSETGSASSVPASLVSQPSYIGDVSALTMGSEIMDKVYEDLSYTYSLEAGMVGGSGSEYKSESGSDISSRLVLRTVVAPPGKLGIVIDTTVEGPVVKKVNSQGPLAGILFPGDIIVAVNDVDTRTMSPSAITALMVLTSQSKRKLTVLCGLSLI